MDLQLAYPVQEGVNVGDVIADALRADALPLRAIATLAPFRQGQGRAAQMQRGLLWREIFGNKGLGVRGRLGHQVHGRLPVSNAGPSRRLNGRC